MQPYTHFEGIGCPLPWAGIDTDQLIPARFMKRTRAEGCGDVLLHDGRFDAGGAPPLRLRLVARGSGVCAGGPRHPLRGRAELR